MPRTGSEKEARELRLKRLAENIDALVEKDERSMRHARDVRRMRREAACELYSICSDFVVGLNGRLARGEVILDPVSFGEDSFQEESPNLVQMNIRGRILQIQFEATVELISTEDFRIPYTLEGAVRAFNQELLDKDIIEEQLIFYTWEKQKKMWRFFDPRTYRSGPFDEEYLIGLLEQLI
ncbi:MAG TPA: hypothetical protein VKU19_42155 [Bryobacteraceae bacterium]|nr:hypothetical protein [Bryobacteraceae bacterium]